MKTDIIEAFSTLANIAGGVIKDGEFMKCDISDTNVKKVNYEEEKNFYCLTVPSSSFIVKYNDKISVTGNCHSVAGAEAFRIAINECLEDNILTQDDINNLKSDIIKSGKQIKEHEFRIIEMIFEKGEISGFKEKDIKTFVKSRINLCLNNLGIDSIYEIKDNPIAEWFYSMNNTLVVHDFFSSLGNQYNRNWSEGSFVVESNTYNFKG